MSWIVDLLNFADQLCDALNQPAYVGVARVEDEHLLGAGFRGKWCGSRWRPEGMVSKAPHVVFSKVGELVLAGAGLDGTLITTPVAGYELGLGWMGGVALNGTVVGVSKWAQQHDRLLALTVLYHNEVGELKLHHRGRRFETEVAFREEAQVLLQSVNGALQRPTSDHERYYHPISRWYDEIQWFPDGPHDSAQHWDFVTADPEGFLRFVAEAYGEVPVIFDDSGPNDPVGVFWAKDKDGNKLGVMARKIWWEV